MKMRRCEDEKVRYRPPLLEEPCAQTLSGKNVTKCYVTMFNWVRVDDVLKQFI